MNIIGCKLPIKPMFFELDITDPPPVLTLAINPTDFSKSLTKKVTQARNRPSTRNNAAYIFNHDIDELDTLNCSGTTALFYGPNGLTTESRKDTLAYRNFKSLVQVYRNNGRNYNTRVTNTSPLLTGGSGLINTVGKVIIAYDDVLYKGSFDSMSINETDDKPFNFSFSFQYTVTELIDVRNI